MVHMSPSDFPQIYQEVTTPGRITFWFGQHHFDDFHLSATLYFARQFSYSPDFHFRYNAAAAPGSGVSLLNDARISRESLPAGATQRTLLELLLESRQTACTDPRDKVFSLIPHASDVAADAIPIDYSKTLEQVSADVVRFMLSSSSTPYMEVFGLVYTPWPDARHKNLRQTFQPPLPSWMPDMRQCVSIPNLNERRADMGPVYTTCPIQTVSASINGAELHIQGIVSSQTISFLTNVWDQAGIATRKSPEWLETVRNSGLVRPSQSVTIEDTVAGTLVADKSRITIPKSQPQFPRPYRRGNAVDWNLLSADPATLPPEAAQHRLRMLDNVAVACFGKRMGVTSSGSMGLFPAGTDLGDRVALFLGGGTLYVVRPSETGKYQFIGECYVDGMMDGALMEQEVARGNAAGTIVLI